jgi:hypothetical protein
VHPITLLATSSRGQSTLEAIGLALAVAALLATLVVVRPGLVDDVVHAVAGAFGAERGSSSAAGARPPTHFSDAPPDVQRFVLRAVAGSAEGAAPTIIDAGRRLTGVLGPEAGERELAALAWSNLLARAPWVAPGGTFRAVDPNELGRFEGSRLNGVGPVPDEDRTMFWSTERPRSAGVSTHVTTLDEERRLVEELQPGWTDRIGDMAVTGGETVLAAVHPAAGIVFAAVHAADAGLSRGDATGSPPGAREGDVTFCAEVERTNHLGPDGQRFLATAQALRPEEPVRMIRLAIVRDGRLVAEGLANQEHCG